MIDYKYNENKYLYEVGEYIDKTYGQHYAKGSIETLEYINDIGIGNEFIRGNIIKYASRQGSKEGQERKDILKIIHYGLMLLDNHDKWNESDQKNTSKLSKKSSRNR